MRAMRIGPAKSLSGSSFPSAFLRGEESSNAFMYVINAGVVVEFSSDKEVRGFQS